MENWKVGLFFQNNTMLIKTKGKHAFGLCSPEGPCLVGAWVPSRWFSAGEGHMQWATEDWFSASSGSFYPSLLKLKFNFICLLKWIIYFMYMSIWSSCYALCLPALGSPWTSLGFWCIRRRAGTFHFIDWKTTGFLDYRLVGSHWPLFDWQDYNLQ